MILNVKNISSGYTKKLSLRDVSFNFETGSVLCVIGHNGSGKSTLFKTILGIVKKENGEVYIDNENIENWNDKKRAEYFSYVPQNHNAVFGYSVVDVVVMGCVRNIGLISSPSKKDFEKARNALKRVGISYLEKRRYTELSGGEKKLVLIARALCQEAKFMIMDEPTSDLDFVKSQLIYDVIRSLSNEGYGIILSTHAPDYPFLDNDKLLLLKKGKTVAFGNATEVLNSDNLQKAYDTPMEILEVTDSKGQKRRMFVVLKDNDI